MNRALLLRLLKFGALQLLVSLTMDLVLAFLDEAEEQPNTYWWRR